MDYSYKQISDESMIAISLMIAFGIIIPLSLAIIWSKTKQQKLIVTVVGTLSFIIFALILETIPRYLLFEIDSPVCKFINNNIWVYGFTGALIASVFEEASRYVSFKYVLKKTNSIQSSISYGLGHGGFEMVYILFIGGLQNLVYATSINSGRFQNLLNNPELNSEQINQLLQLPSAIASITLGTFLLALTERISALLLQISCSIIVFKSVKEKKVSYYVIAMLFHFSLDFLITFYNKGLIANIVVFEGIILFLSIILFLFTINFFYKRGMDANPTHCIST